MSERPIAHHQRIITPGMRSLKDITPEELLVAARSSYSMRALCRRLRVSRGKKTNTILRGRLAEMGEDLKHFDPNTKEYARVKQADRFKRTVLTEKNGYERDLNSILVENSDGYSSGMRTVVRKITERGILPNRCAACGQGPEWLGKPLQMTLFQKNGIANDLRLENIMLVCPNCRKQIVREQAAQGWVRGRLPAGQQPNGNGEDKGA